MADENGKFCREKVKFLKFSRKSKNFSKIGGENLKQGGKCIMASGGMDAPDWESPLHINQSTSTDSRAIGDLSSSTVICFMHSVGGNRNHKQSILYFSFAIIQSPNLRPRVHDHVTSGKVSIKQTVCPYAKTVALYPSKQLLTKGSTHF